MNKLSNTPRTIAEPVVHLRMLTALSVFSVCGFIPTASWGQQPDAADNAAQLATPQQEDNPAPVAIARRDGHLVQIALPVTAAVQEQVEATIRRIADQAPPAAAASDRPVVVLEFDTSNGRDGRGSRFGSCTDLARFLISNEVSGLEFVAYVPAPKGFMANPDILQAAKPKSQLTGHAVLIALACNHIVMHQEAEMGQAGVDEPVIDDGLRNTYRQITTKRLPFPAEVAVSMLDPDASLYRADIGNGRIVYVDRDQLNQLEADGQVVQSETMTEQGTLPLYSSQLLAKYQLLRHRVTSRRDIAERFRLQTDALEGDPTLGGEWQAAILPLQADIDQRTVNWVLNALNQESTKTNLIIVNLDSQDGDLAQCARLAGYLADYDANKVRTVAYIPTRAQGAAALVALACDHIVMGPDALLGGRDTGAPDRRPGIAEGYLPAAKEIAEKTDRDWSLIHALLNPEAELSLWSNKQTGQLRLMGADQVAEMSPEEASDWVSLRQVAVATGLNGAEAESYFVARYVVDSLEQLKSLYQIKTEPTVLEQTLTDRWIDVFARQLATPWISAWLLFGAMFFLSTEMSSPGIGVPGFLGSLCLLLFFWSQYCNGNANWLEILLFVVGIGFLALELFVLPGFGVFGVGGIIMVFVSLVLASQTFIIPRTSEEFDRLPISLSMVLAAGGGFLIAVFMLRKYLSRIPMVKRLMLEPPGNDDALDSLSQREQLVRWDHLRGQQGKCITRLAPAGKARFGNQIVDVITDGELIEPGQPVTVHEVSGNRVVVRSIQVS